MIPASAEHGSGEPLRPELEETVQDHSGLVRRVQGEHAGKDAGRGGQQVSQKRHKKK